jgi:hypothetical protein
VALQVQTKLETPGVKTAAPVKRTVGSKVMPFDRNPELINVAVKRPPSIFYFTPGIHLGRASGNHSA